MDKILAEQAFQQTGCTTQECAVKLGKVLNVKYLVVGTFGQVLGQYVVAIRVVDVESARVIYSDEVEGNNLPALRSGVKELARRLGAAVKAAR
jgi:TolB-like protein